MSTENKSPYFDRTDLLILQMAFDTMREREEQADDKRLLEMAKELVKALKPSAPDHAIDETARFLLNTPKTGMQ